MKLVIRLVVMGAALWVADALFAGISAEEDAVLVYVGMAIVLTLVNALVRPVLMMLTCPVQLITLGLFAFVVNAVAFWLASWLAQAVGIDFVVAGFVPALLGSLVVSLVSTVLNAVLTDNVG